MTGIKPLVSTLVGLTVLDKTIKITREYPRMNRRGCSNEKRKEGKSLRRL